MLWLHMGMPKTGTTALQGFLRSNGALLDEIGLRYMEAGRRRLEGSQSSGLEPQYRCVSHQPKRRTYGPVSRGDDQRV